MYELYADGTSARSDSSDVLDRWIIARLNQLIAEVTKGYENYELDKATRPIADFIDDLSVWYLRRSRERFKSEDVRERVVVLGTLRYVLRELSKVMAPAMPFYAEYLYRAVREEGEALSVHLTKWPDGGEVDLEVINQMSVVRVVITFALEQRAKAQIKVRQPLSSLEITDIFPEVFVSLIKDEVNVKEVVMGANVLERGKLNLEITPELKAEGVVREFMRAVQEGRKAEGFSPQDRVELIVSTDATGEALLTDFASIIKKTVGATTITFSGEEVGRVIDTGEQRFQLTLKRL
jgi:isoleucyl-tRNA synthetase